MERAFRRGQSSIAADAATRADENGRVVRRRRARLLLEVLRDRVGDVLRFAHDLRVPPTSNQAERDLWPSKIQQKFSGRLTSTA